MSNRLHRFGLLLLAACLLAVPSARADAGTGHTNVAYYSFEDYNVFAHDYSGHGNEVNGVFAYGGRETYPYLTNDTAAGFDAIGYTGLGFQLLPTNLIATLGGSFSVSLWARTSQNQGNDSDLAYYGAGLLAANDDQVIPLALTGSKVAFLTGGGSLDTLHSVTSVNTGSYVHLVVTRDQTTGKKSIYVNGGLDASDYSATGHLNTGLSPEVILLGMNSSYVAGFIGIMDEVQIYSGVLSGDEVLHLYNNPGTTNVDRTDLEAALDTTGLTWTTGGDTSWLLETTNTHDGVFAAQSGSVTNGQTTQLLTTVTGPGTLTFWWSTQTPGDEIYFELEFDIDYSYQDHIDNNQPWVQESTINIPAGTHTLTWTAFGGDYASDAGFVDHVSFTPIALTTVLQSAFFHLVVVNDQSVLTPGGGFWAEPYLFQVQPEPLTVDEIASPNEKFTYFYTNEFTDGALHHDLMNSWAELANECTNGLWTLYVNKGDPSEKQFKFSVTLDSLDTNLLSPVTVLTPADGSVNVTTNTPIEWSVPNSPNGRVGVDILQPPPFNYLYSNDPFPASATNWIPTGPLNYGTNFAEIEIFYPTPAIASITPTNAAFDVISNWTTTGEIETRASDSFVVGAPAPLPVHLISSPPITSGGDFLLSFQTLAGRPEIIQISTNLTTGWMDATNFIGDGSVYQFTFPTTNAPGAYFRVVTQ